MTIDPVLAASVRLYVARDWGRFERERDAAFEGARRRTALVAEPRTRPRAHAVFARAGASYHPIARAMVEGLLRDAA